MQGANLDLGAVGRGKGGQHAALVGRVLVDWSEDADELRVVMPFAGVVDESDPIEAGDSLGMSRADVVRFIVLPQALRNVLPPLAGQFIQLIKDSSLVSLVSIQELSFMAQDIQVATQRVFEVFVFVAALYFVICFGLSQLFGVLERRAARAHR